MGWIKLEISGSISMSRKKLLNFFSEVDPKCLVVWRISLEMRHKRTSFLTERLDEPHDSCTWKTQQRKGKLIQQKNRKRRKIVKCQTLPTQRFEIRIRTNCPFTCLSRHLIGNIGLSCGLLAPLISTKSAV